MITVGVYVHIQGGYAGDAIGFRLQSLAGLDGIRANGGRLSLLHLIVTVSHVTTMTSPLGTRLNGTVTTELASNWAVAIMHAAYNHDSFV